MIRDGLLFAGRRFLGFATAELRTWGRELPLLGFTAAGDAELLSIRDKLARRRWLARRQREGVYRG